MNIVFFTSFFPISSRKSAFLGDFGAILQENAYFLMKMPHSRFLVRFRKKNAVHDVPTCFVQKLRVHE